MSVTMKSSAMSSGAAGGNASALAPSGNIIAKPFIYGTTSKQFAKKRDSDGHTHEWTVYVKPYDNEDMSAYVKKVQFKLHESYVNPSRVVTKPPYEVSETGWGEFEIQIKIYFNEPLDRPVVLYHVLKLFHTMVVPTVDVDGSGNNDSSDKNKSRQLPTTEIDPAVRLNLKADDDNAALSTTVCHIIQGRKHVVSESYDEFMFNEPSQYVQAMLTITRPLTLNAYKHETDFAAREEAILAKICRTRARVKAEITDFKKALEHSCHLLREIKPELEALDGQQFAATLQQKR